MDRRKIVVSILAVMLMIGLVVGFAIAQDAGGPGGRGDRGKRGDRGQWDPAQMQQRIMERTMERIKETLGSSDEEWTVLKPKVEKVVTLSRETGGGMRGMMMGGRRVRPGRGTQDTPTATDQTQPQPQSEIEKATAALRETLENEEAKAEEIKEKLTDLRKAREKAKQELAAAQQSLRELLTQRQEAQLVLMGILE